MKGGMMGKETEQEETQKKNYPGVSLELFKAAVEVIVELRDTGKFLIFLGRTSSLRIIGNEDEYISLMQKKEECSNLDKEHAREVLRELKRYARIYGTLQSENSIVSFLTRTVYDDEYDEQDEKGKEIFENTIRTKVELTKEYLYTESFTERRLRLDSATVPCLEDVDYELVKERKNTTDGRKVEDPFLRIRLRHTKEEAGEFNMFGRFSLSWSDISPMGMSSFEIECDESDIDLLLTRLVEAKGLLIDARELKNKNE